MGADCGRAHFRHEAATRATLVGEQLPAVRRERRARRVGAGDRWRRVTLPSFIATEYNG